MRFSGPTFTQREILPADIAYPPEGRCKSGHLAAKGSRFFFVSSPTLPKDRWGVYCETCLRIAHKLTAKREKQKALYRYQ